MIIVSIVIYKHSYLDLKPTIDSLLSVSIISKIILIDNDSSYWAQNLLNDRIFYVQSDGNFGFGYGHNLAIKKYAQESEYFLICNPDIVFQKEQFDSFLDFIKNRTEGLFLPKIVYPNGDDQYGARLLPSPLNLFARRFSKKLAIILDDKYLLKKNKINDAVFVPYLSGCFMLFRSKCLLELGGFDERFFMYMEDVDISRRCAEKFGTLYCPQFSIIHAHEQASYKNKKLLKAHLRSAILYFNKWGWVYDPIRRSLNEQCLDSLDFK